MTLKSLDFSWEDSLEDSDQFPTSHRHIPVPCFAQFPGSLTEVSSPLHSSISTSTTQHIRQDLEDSTLSALSGSGESHSISPPEGTHLEGDTLSGHRSVTNAVVSQR